ncbi:MAG: hypothetical protein AAF721_04840 [Myxococcota bacterium]
MDTAAHSFRDAHAGTLVASVAIGAGAGWLLSGPLAAIALGVVCATITTVVIGARRMRGVGRALDGPAPDLSQLPAKQALAALSAATGGAGTFDSPAMRALEGVADKEDPNTALAEAIRVRNEFPRSPLVAAELSRRHAAVGNDDDAGRCASEAIALALDGGMNPMAAKLFKEFRDRREALTLSDAQRRRLAGAAETADDDSGAAWCRKDLD